MGRCLYCVYLGGFGGRGLDMILVPDEGIGSLGGWGLGGRFGVLRVWFGQWIDWTRKCGLAEF